MKGAGIEFRGVSRFYAETGAVLENIAFKVLPGQFLSLLGPSGCGKSTLLRLIADLEQPNQGGIQVSGEEGKKVDRAYVFQESHLLPWRTTLENAALPLELKRPRIEPAEIRTRAAAVLANLGLTDSLDKFPKQLSGGMKMRASVARALVGLPDLLLLDEPFSALDDLARHHLQEDLRSLWAESGMTVVFVTHSVSEAIFLSDRVMVLSPRPARILRDIPVDLGLVRNEDTRQTSRYLQLVNEASRAYAQRETAR